MHHTHSGVTIVHRAGVAVVHWGHRVEHTSCTWHIHFHGASVVVVVAVVATAAAAIPRLMTKHLLSTQRFVPIGDNADRRIAC